jgi:hypothetical protein
MDKANEEPDTSGQESLQQDPRLDFTSSEFDPSVALQTQGLQPPLPDAPVLDNVSKCAALLPEAEAQKAQQRPLSAEVSLHNAQHTIAAFAWPANLCE